MNIGGIIEQAAKLLWQHKVLTVMGIVDVILTSSGLAARAALDLSIAFFGNVPEVHALLPAQPPPPLVTLGQIGQLYRAVSPFGAAGWIGLIGGTLIVVIALAVIGIVIEGGLIAAIARAGEELPTVGRMLAAGWRCVLPMVVIASVPAIPLTVGAILAVAIGTTIIQGAGGIAALAANVTVAQQALSQIAAVALAILCLPGLVTLPLVLLSVLAYRACMIENMDAIASLRRAWGALRAHPGPILLLAVISYGVSTLAIIVAYLPNALALVFLPAMVIVWAIQGMARAYYLTLWTLGWQTWAEKLPKNQ